MLKLIKKKFYFIRHGRTDWNDKNLCQGQVNIPLNPIGINEIEQICPLISGLSFSRIVTSPLLRTLETARIIQKHTQRPIEILEEIQEKGWGAMEGATSAEMYKIEEQEENNESFISELTIESRSLFKSRILSGMNIALEEDTPLIVSHGRVFLILSEILGIPPIRQIPNAAIMECNPTDSGWNLILHRT